MAKFLMQEVLGAEAITARLGAGTTVSNWLTNLDVGKFVKLTADSRYALAAAGDKIDGTISSVETAPLDGYSVGGVNKEGRRTVVCDGLEATAGTGTLAVGDFVVCGTSIAKGTAITEDGPRVCKATNQPGATVTSADNVVGNINAAIAKVVDAQNVLLHGWRVVSLGTVGTGAVGTTAVIEEAV